MISALKDTVLRLMVVTPEARWGRNASGNARNATRSPAHSDLEVPQMYTVRSGMAAASGRNSRDSRNA